MAVFCAERMKLLAGPLIDNARAAPETDPASAAATKN
jgi:hypothetical protein